MCSPRQALQESQIKAGGRITARMALLVVDLFCRYIVAVTVRLSEV